MYLVAIAWLYVVLLMALAEGTAVNGSWLGAAVTLALYGALPLAIALYLLSTPARRAARRRAEVLVAGSLDPDGGRHAAGDAIAPKREEP
jgi:hypothetical protein